MRPDRRARRPVVRALDDVVAGDRSSEVAFRLRQAAREVRRHGPGDAGRVGRVRDADEEGRVDGLELRAQERELVRHLRDLLRDAQVLAAHGRRRDDRLRRAGQHDNPQVRARPLAGGRQGDEVRVVRFVVVVGVAEHRAPQQVEAVQPRRARGPRERRDELRERRVGAGVLVPQRPQQPVRLRADGPARARRPEDLLERVVAAAAQAGHEDEPSLVREGPLRDDGVVAGRRRRRDCARVGVPAPRRRRRGVVRGAARHVADGAVLALLGRADRREPRVQRGAQRLRPLRPRGREVPRLAGVRPEVVERDALGDAPAGVERVRPVRHDELLVAVEPGLLVAVLEAQRPPARPPRRGAAPEGVQRVGERLAVERAILESPQRDPRRQLHERGQHVRRREPEGQHAPEPVVGEQRRHADAALEQAPLPPAERRRRPGRAVLGAVVGEKQKKLLRGARVVREAADRRVEARERAAVGPVERAAARLPGRRHDRQVRRVEGRYGERARVRPQEGERGVRDDLGIVAPRVHGAVDPVGRGVPVVRAPGLPVRGDVRGAPEPLVPRRAGHAARLVRRHLRLRRKTRGEVAVPGRRDVGRDLAPAAAVLVVRAQHADVPLAEVARRVAHPLSARGSEYSPSGKCPWFASWTPARAAWRPVSSDARVGEQTGDAA